MIKTKVFQSGNSQAVRIPNEFHTDQKEFYIRKLGECIYLTPVTDPWALIRSSLGAAADQPDMELDQPMLSELPEREEF